MQQENNILFSDLAGEIDRDSGVPLYIQLALKVENWINKGILEPDQPLPGNIELGKMAGVNFNTVGKAMAQLVDKGLIVRRRRAGTFVAPDAAIENGNIGFYYLNERESITLNEAETFQALLNEKHYDLKLIPISWDFFKQTNLSADIKKRNLDGAIFTALPDNACLDSLLKLEKENFAHVRIGNRYHEDKLTSPLVSGDDETRLAETFKRLRQAGHKNIGMLGGNADFPVGQRYRQYMFSGGTGVPPVENIYNTAPNSLAGYSFPRRYHLPLSFDGPFTLPNDRSIPQIVRGYLSENKDLTAVIVWNPNIAKELIKQARQIGRAVPEDLSVICLRDGTIYGVPAPCDSFAIDKRKMSELCASALLDELNIVVQASSLPSSGSADVSGGTGVPPVERAAHVASAASEVSGQAAAPSATTKSTFQSASNTNHQVYLPFHYIDRGTVAVNPSAEPALTKETELTFEPPKHLTPKDATSVEADNYPDQTNHPVTIPAYAESETPAAHEPEAALV